MPKFQNIESVLRDTLTSKTKEYVPQKKQKLKRPKTVATKTVDSPPRNERQRKPPVPKAKDQVKLVILLNKIVGEST